MSQSKYVSSDPNNPARFDASSSADANPVVPPLVATDLPAATPSPRPYKVYAVGIGIGLIVIVALFFLFARGLQLRSAAPLAAGAPPDFTYKTFEGQTYKLSDLKGKAVVINFWASWCIPCRDEAPALQRAWAKYKDQGLIILGVDYVDTEPEAKKFIAEFGQTYPNGPDLQTKISDAYHITGVPETYFVGKDGRLLPGNDTSGRANGNYIGPVPESVLDARIQQMLSVK